MRSLAAAILLLTLAPPASAQSSLADIKAKLDGHSSELAEVDAMLADPDKNRRIAAMELLLQSGNPVFIQRAKEAGLFSSDIEMQMAALKAIFDGGGPFTLMMDLTKAKEEQTAARAWLSTHGGTWDETGTIGTVTFATGDFDPKRKCWILREGRSCAITLSAITVSLAGWHDGSGTLKLNAEGALRGTFKNTDNRGRFAPVPAQILLIE